MDLKEKQLECPFTWGIVKQWAREFDEMDEPDIEFDVEPLLAFISSIMITYFRAEKENYQAAFVNLKDTENIWEKLDKSELESNGVSTKVLRHIKVATEYFMYDLARRKLEADNVLKSLESSESFQSICDVATIEGCKSVAWSSFHERGHEKSTEFSRLASAKSPNCPLWHYILGKSLRLSRRYVFGNYTPLDEEQDAIMKSCKLSSTPFYKIRLAQMYREKKDHLKSKQIYLELFAANPKCSSILLRLASALMSEFEDFDRAKKCLDEAGKYKKNLMYYHYLGVYYTKRKDFMRAIEHYGTATMIGNNYKSDLLYAAALRKVDKNFDFIQKFESMLIKYSRNLKHQQQIFLHLGMHYYFKKDVEISLNYFRRSIEVDPENHQLTKFFNCTIDWKCYNIYDFVGNILQEYGWHSTKSSNIENNDLKKLEDYCKQYQEAQLTGLMIKISL